MIGDCHDLAADASFQEIHIMMLQPLSRSDAAQGSFVGSRPLPRGDNVLAYGLRNTTTHALRGPRTDALAQQEALQRAFGNEVATPASNEGRVLLLENIHEKAAALLTSAGCSNISQKRQALEGGALCGEIRDVSVIGLRSRTRLDAQAIAVADQLLAVGCFGVGTDQVDLDAAKDRGIPVFNAPFANTRSVAELVVGEIIVLVRQIFPRSVAAHSGQWTKGAAGSHEIRGKTLGIVGYGNIGSQLSQLAEAMGMKVVYFDIADKLSHGNAVRADNLMALLECSDVVSLHVPETPATNRMIGRRELAAMHDGAYLINSSRGTVVDLIALADELRSGRLGGAAVDVFPDEPSSGADTLLTPLRGLPNVILTPHIGGSTEEAQERIGEEVARKLSSFMRHGSTEGAVNFPELQVPPQSGGPRLIYVYRAGPRAMQRLSAVFARRQIDVTSQYCKTDGDIGYAVIDIEPFQVAPEVLMREIRALEGTIRVRFV
jgi:D-3-phosphoglycerate dehydrogenase / 2-oxoglutarate reductase